MPILAGGEERQKKHHQFLRFGDSGYSVTIISTGFINPTTVRKDRWSWYIKKTRGLILSLTIRYRQLNFVRRIGGIENT